MSTDSMEPPTSLHHEMQVAADLADVRASLVDPATLVSCIPGASVISTEGQSVRARFRVRVNPVPDEYAVEARLSEAGDGTISLVGSAQDRRAGVGAQFRLDFAVTEDAPGQTRCVLSGELAGAADGTTAQLIAERLVPQFRRRLEQVASERIEVSEGESAAAGETVQQDQRSAPRRDGNRRKDALIAGGISLGRSAGVVVRRQSAQLLRRYLSLTSRK